MSPPAVADLDGCDQTQVDQEGVSLLIQGDDRASADQELFGGFEAKRAAVDEAHLKGLEGPLPRELVQLFSPHAENVTDALGRINGDPRAGGQATRFRLDSLGRIENTGFRTL